MILTEISDLLVVDQLLIENAEKYTYFLSHLSSDFYIGDNFSQKIYTSSHIGNILSSVCKVIPLRCIQTLKNGEKHSLLLPNGNTVIVTMFKDEESSGNVLFHFETHHCTALYLGHFKQITKIMWNKTFIDLVSKGVDYLYIDNTNSISVLHSTAFEVGCKIKELLNSHTKIILNTPLFGYEDLIKTFVQDFDFKVLIRNDITKAVFYNASYKTKFSPSLNDCQIALIMDSADLDLIEKRLKAKNIATVRLFDFEKHFEYTKYEKCGLYQLCYSSHISQMEIFAFISIIQPKIIKEIYSELPSIPNFVKSASKHWKVIDQDVQNLNVDNDLKEIEDFAPKTAIDSPEQLQNFLEETLSNNQLTENVTIKSSDCEEVCASPDKLNEKINTAVLNLPRRRKVRQKPITLDSNPDKCKDSVESSQIKIEKEASFCEKEISKNDEFNSLMNTNFSHFPSIANIDDSEVVEVIHSAAVVHSSKLENGKLQISRKQKEQNENYFSFLDNNSISSKDSSNNDDEKNITNDIDTNAQNMQVAISYTLLERAMEDIHKDKLITNRIENNKKESHSVVDEASQKVNTLCNSNSLIRILENSNDLIDNEEKQSKSNENNKTKDIDKNFNESSDLKHHLRFILGIKKENELKTQFRSIEKDIDLESNDDSLSQKKKKNWQTTKSDR